MVLEDGDRVARDFGEEKSKGCKGLMSGQKKKFTLISSVISKISSDNNSSHETKEPAH